MEFSKELGLRVLLCPIGSNLVVRTACCSVGTVLPVYSTFKAIERKIRMSSRNGLFTGLFMDLSVQWKCFQTKSCPGGFPLYYPVKFAFLVWLQLPSTLGATKLYSNHLRPLLLRHQAMLDQFAEFMNSGMVTFMTAYEGQLRCAKGLFSRTVSLARHLILPDEKPKGRAVGGSVRGRSPSDAESSAERRVQLDEGWTVLPGDLNTHSPES